MTLDNVPFAHIALVDDHAHPWLNARAVDSVPFARFFGEAEYPQPDTLFYRTALTQLAHLLGCADTESEVVAARQRPDFARLLVREANVQALLIDDGYPRENALSVEEIARDAAVSAHRIVRVERLAEDLIQTPGHRELTRFQDALLSALNAARPTIVGLKSVIAYRTGLDVGLPDTARAAAALKDVPPGRLAVKSLNDFVFHVAADWAAQQGLPLQVHTGFGDRDLDLRLSNPLHLRPLLESGVLARGPLVLLHASYPFVREASYLAAVYPNVFIDISEAAPLLAGPALVRVIEDLLALAPVTRIVYGSDAWGIPDWIWLAAREVRQALGTALRGQSQDSADWVAQR